MRKVKSLDEKNLQVKNTTHEKKQWMLIVICHWTWSILSKIEYWNKYMRQI